MKKPTIQDLAEAAGIARSTASRVLKNHPEAPTDTVEEFAAWHSTNILRDSSGDPEMRAEKLRKLTADASLSEARLEILSGGYVKIEDAKSIIASLAGELQAALKFRLGSELPPTLAGLTGPKIKLKVHSLLDDIFQQHRNGTLQRFSEAEADTRAALASDSVAKSQSRQSRPRKSKGQSKAANKQ